ncbi:hypothetical protein Taro_018913 [Colocasia esculenta]|uniref:Chlorophyllase n=1 Tax=Colocasia esculenta TaxID=4460 RepID=A0A843USB2_COLES|nr:hypothetical protein [Colocasia esculenta]
MAPAVASIFEHGKLRVQSYEKEQTDASSPPRALLIISPTEAGRYPVILFLPGKSMRIHYYRQLFEHVASHGYIAVVPQLPCSEASQPQDIESAAGGSTNSSLPSSNEDIDAAAAVANWIPKGLQPALPSGVQLNLHKLALAGHSKGGHTAFALAMKKYAPTTLDFSVVVGVDPNGGFFSQITPRLLTYVPNSFTINVPVLIVGSGLGVERARPHYHPCAPKGLNYAEFFNECKPPCSYFVVKDYGHLDMLDDDTPQSILDGCKCGERRTRSLMRTTTAGLIVAFFEAYLHGDRRNLDTVVADPAVAPARLDPVDEKPGGCRCCCWPAAASRALKN